MARIVRDYFEKPMNLKRFYFIAFTALAVSGCTTANTLDVGGIDAGYTGSVSGGTAYGLERDLHSEVAFVDLPKLAAKPLSIRARKYSNGIRQTSVFAGDRTTRGENYLRVDLVSINRRLNDLSDNLPVKSPTNRQIRIELNRAFTHSRMAISAELVTNRYGPFGFAQSSSSAQAPCYYAWQAVSSKAQQSKGIIPNVRNVKANLNIRFRLCRAGLSKAEFLRIYQSAIIKVEPRTALFDPDSVWGGGETSILGSPSVPLSSQVVAPRAVAPVAAVASAPVRKKPVTRRPVKSTVKPKVVAQTQPAVVYSPPLPGALPAEETAPAPIVQTPMVKAVTAPPVPKSTVATQVSSSATKPAPGYAIVPLPTGN